MSRHHDPITVGRIYDRLGPDGSYRVLVDRLWPRGIKREDAALDEWAKDVAPSDELRRWYGHDPTKYDEFAKRYRAELRRTPAATAVRRLLDVATHRRVTLLTATRDIQHSGARVLLDHLTRRMR